MNNIELVKKRIKEIISKSTVPEDPLHSINTLEWLLKIDPNADEALIIAALGHDIDRAIIEGKIMRADFSNYNDFKQAHARNSARILEDIMIEFEVDQNIISDVRILVQNHEIGGNDRTDMLKDADSISYFDTNLPLYFARNVLEETQRRTIWGYKRLSPRMKERLKTFRYDDSRIENLVKSVIFECEKETC